MYTDQKTKFDYIRKKSLFYSTVTDFAKFLGLSMSQFFKEAT